MKSEARILAEAGIDDPLEVFDGKNLGHIKEGFMMNYRTKPEVVDPVHKAAIEQHLRWCKTCQARQFLPLRDE